MPFKLYIYLGAFVTYCDPILVISIMHISSPNPMLDHLFESSYRDDSNKWSNIEFDEGYTQEELIEVYLYAPYPELCFCFRGLEYLCEVFFGIIKGHLKSKQAGDASSDGDVVKKACQEAYEITLKAHHNFMMKGIVKVIQY